MYRWPREGKRFSWIPTSDTRHLLAPDAPENLKTKNLHSGPIPRMTGYDGTFFAHRVTKNLFSRLNAMAKTRKHVIRLVYPHNFPTRNVHAFRGESNFNQKCAR